MKKTIICLAAAVLVAWFAAPASVGGSDFDEKEACRFYQACIEKEMAKCQQKQSLGGSPCENLRKYAKCKSCKAKFLSAHKEELVREMLEKRIVLRPPRVEAYLNQRFFGAYRGGGASQTEMGTQD